MNLSNRFLLFFTRNLFVFFMLIILMLPSCTSNENSDRAIDNSALYPYFPSRMHAFIWRNWESVPLERISKVLDTPAENVLKAGLSMGLPPYVEPGPEFEQRGYISLIRRNWHLISYDQMLTLLNWNSEQLDMTLRDDDFLSHKVGGMKPECSPVQYTPPTPR